MWRARVLMLVDAVDGAEIDGVDGEAVEGVGGQSDDVAGVEAVGDDLAMSSGSGSSGWMRRVSAVKCWLLCRGWDAWTGYCKTQQPVSKLSILPRAAQGHLGLG